MEKLSGKQNNLLKNVFLTVSMGVLGGVLALCTFGDTVVATSNKFIYGTIILVAIIFLYVFLRHMENFLRKIPSKCVYLWTILFFILLTFVSIMVRNEPTADCEMVYKAAVHYINGEEVGWEYFSRWTNNYFLFWILVFGGKLSLLLGIQDIFYVLVTLNALATSITVLCVFKIIEYYEPEKRYLQYFGAVMMMAFLPLWAGTQYIYSDSTSILFGVATILCLIKSKKRTLLWLVLGGISMAIGLLLKPTTCVCVVAFCIIELLFNYSKGEWRSYIVLFGVTVILLFAFSRVKANAPYHQHDAECKAPFQFWFALGLLGDGSFVHNLEFADECLMAKTYAERSKIANDVIKSELGQLVTWEHIREKALYNFGDGTFGCYLFQYHVGLGYQLFNPFGRFGGYSANVATVYFWLILLFAMLSGIIMLFDKKKSRPLLTWLFGFFGIAVFLMLWEANNRQMYNQIPLLALLGCFSIDYLFDKIKLFFKKEEIDG